MDFYLPNFEDMVDPEFDFINDEPSANRDDRWQHDKFAHWFFQGEQIFDGMLVSRASIKPSTEEKICATGGIHAFTELDPTIPVMGDCGAFSYIEQEWPVHTVPQVLDYYQTLGFNYGVSLDHLAFVTIAQLEKALKKGKVKERWWTNKTIEQIQEERFELTLRNAQEFLDLHSRQKPAFKPIGIAQGWSPERYAYAVEQLVGMGYERIALGGLVKSKDAEIVTILEEIHPLVRNGIQLHILGVARLSLIPHFLRLNVTSVDSAAPLRRAFLGTGEDNYWTLSGPKYTAIRISEAKSTRGKRGVDHPDDIVADETRPVNSIEELVALEQAALSKLRAYHRGEAGFEETLQAILAYDNLFGEDRNHETRYRRVLQDKPWQKCGCAICKQIGVEVIIFRGNNRNRRRGFHNVRVFYEQFGQAARQAHSKMAITHGSALGELEQEG